MIGEGQVLPLEGPITDRVHEWFVLWRVQVDERFGHCSWRRGGWGPPAGFLPLWR